MEQPVEYLHDQDDDDRGDSKANPIADIVSLETVVNVLVRKGVCTSEELFEEERKLRNYGNKFKEVRVVRTSQDSAVLQREELRRKQNWLKRKMSKRRWSRQLGTRLFGWQWKKVRIEPNANKLYQ